METGKLGYLAEFIRIRNVADGSIAKLIGRPATSGAIAEFVAAAIFDIALHPNAAHPTSDGRFRSGPYIDQTVNVKYVSQNSGLVDLAQSLDAVDHPDIYLVITGPRIKTASSLSRVTPWVITDVYLFGAPLLVDRLAAENVKIGTATSIRQVLWEAAHIYPATNTLIYPLSTEQRLALKLFGPVLEEDG